jgi:hypothetical protein
MIDLGERETRGTRSRPAWRYVNFSWSKPSISSNVLDKNVANSTDETVRLLDRSQGLLAREQFQQR